MAACVGRISGPCLLLASASSFLGDLCVLCGQTSCLAFKRIVQEKTSVRNSFPNNYLHSSRRMGEIFARPKSAASIHYRYGRADFQGFETATTEDTRWARGGDRRFGEGIQGTQASPQADRAVPGRSSIDNHLSSIPRPSRSSSCSWSSQSLRC